MHTKRLLTTLGLFLFLSGWPHAILGQKDMAKKKVSIRQEVDMSFENLKRNLKKEKETPARGELVNKFIKSAEQLRKASPRQLEGDEIYMDLLQAGLEEIPLDKEFKPATCKAYEQKILFDFHPDSKQPETEPTRKTLEVLKILCK